MEQSNKKLILIIIMMKMKLKKRKAKMLCKYCQTEQQEQKKCFYCGADLKLIRPDKKQSNTYEEAYQNQPNLAMYHTFDLLLLLSHLRQERSKVYKTMQSVRKAPQEANIDSETFTYDELNPTGQEFYRE